MINVVFVCLGNICRSPMAEGIFKDLIKKRALQMEIYCDSAATSNYHIGALPDKRMCETASKHGITLEHLGRQFGKKDFKDFDYVIGMDRQNIRHIKLHSSGKEDSEKIHLMLEYDTQAYLADVPDPYHGDLDGFEEVYQLLLRSCNSFFEFIIEKHRLNGK